VAGGSDGTVHDCRRRMVAAHRVNGDVDQNYSSSTALTWRPA
jgi:hypothetical protein